MNQEQLDTLDGLFVIAYSVSQDSMLVESVLDNLKKNRRETKAGRGTDYVPLLITDTRAKADKIANKVGIQLRKKRSINAKPNWHSVAEIIAKLDPLSLITTDR